MDASLQRHHLHPPLFLRILYRTCAASADGGGGWSCRRARVRGRLHRGGWGMPDGQDGTISSPGPPKLLRFAYKNRPVDISAAAATVILRDGTASLPTRCWNGSW